MDKIVDQSIDICIEEFQKEKNKKKLENDVLNPIIKYIGERLWPYIMYTIIFISSLLLLLFYIVYILRKTNLKTKPQ